MRERTRGAGAGAGAACGAGSCQSRGVGQLRWIVAGAVVGILSCGGRSLETSDGATPDAAPDSACTCPLETPYAGDDCACDGLACSFPPSFIGCWNGGATCTAGRWSYEYPDNTRCPEEIPRTGRSGFCSGVGSCTYDIDVGCGPTPLEFRCTCTDAAWMLAYPQLPSLCDCAAIASAGVCDLFGSDCVWSESGGSPRCEPAS